MFYIACPNPRCPRKWLSVDPADVEATRAKQVMRVRCRRCRTSFVLRPEQVLESARRPEDRNRPLWNKVASLFTVGLREPEVDGSDVVPTGDRGTGAVPSTGQPGDMPTTEYLSGAPAGLPEWIDDHSEAAKPVAAPGEEVAARKPPKRIGRFEIQAWVGAGSFGTVYRAHDPHLDRPVALKVPRPGTVETPKRLKLFLDEARAAAQLRHPHIVPIYEAGSDNDRPYIAFAFIEGRTLAKAREERRLELRRAVTIVRDLAEALAYAHSQGVVHRDVKPANVLLDPADSSHLADFGLACRYDSPAGEAERRVSGTPVYMSPEHWSGLPGAVQPASDQYSLGVVLYELLCGFPPFEGPFNLLKFNHKKRQPDAPRSNDPTLPRDLEAICLKTLAKRPEERYENCQELADDLRRWLEDEPVKARPLGSGERLLRWCRREPALAATLGFAFAVLLAFGMVMLRSAAAERKQAVVAAQHAEDMKDERDATRQARDEAEGNAREARDNLKKAEENEVESRKNERLAQRNLAGSRLDQALNVCEQGEVGQGLVRLADARRLALQAGASDLVRVIDFNLGAWRRQLHALTALLPHADRVLSAVYSPDGRTVATAGGKEVLLWRTAGGDPLPQKLTHPEPVLALAFGVCETPLLLVAGKKTLHLWDLSKPEQPLASYETRKEEPILTASLSPDGKTALMGGGSERGEDGWARLCVWTPGGKQETTPLFGLSDPVSVTAFSRDGSQGLTGSGSRFHGEARVWDARPGAHFGQALGPALPHNRAVSAAAFSPDGKQILTGTRGLFEGEAQLWDVATGQRKGPPLQSALEIAAVAFSPDGMQAAIGGQDRAVRLWDLRSRQMIGSPMRHAMDVSSVAFSPDGRALLTGSDDHTARLWQLSTGLSPVLSAGHFGLVLAAACNPKRSLFCTGTAQASYRDGRMGLSGKARLWDLQTGETREQLPHPAPVSALAWHPQGHLLATGCWDGSVRLWVLPPGRPGHQFLAFKPDPGDGWVQALAFNADGTRLAIAWRTGAVQMIDMPDSAIRKLWKKKTHETHLYALAFHPDGRHIATGGRDRTIELWNAETGEAIVGPAMTHPDAVLSLAYSRDGRHLLSGYAGGARLWDAGSRRPVRAPFQHQAGVFGTAFGPHPLVLSGGTDRLARLWDLETGKPLGPALPHNGAILAATFTPSGTALLTAGLDTYARLWRVPVPVNATQEQIARWAEVISGIELGEDNTIGMLRSAAWEQRRQTLGQAGGNPAIERRLQEEVAARPSPEPVISVPNPHTLTQGPLPPNWPTRLPGRPLSVAALVEIDVSLLRDPPVAGPALKVLQQTLETHLAANPLLKDLKEPLIDRIQHITIAVSGTLEKPEVLVFVRGTFEAAALHGILDRLARKHPTELRIEKDGRLSIYVSGVADQEGAAAFTDEGTLVVASSRDALRTALDTGEEGLVLGQQRAILPRPRLNRTKGEVVSLALLVTKEMKNLLQEIPGAAGIAPQLRAVTATLDLQKKGAGVDLHILTEDNKTAKLVEGFLRDTFKDVAQAGRLPPEVLQRLKVEGNEVVHLRLFLKEEVLKTLLPGK